jgi:hypothetical protein
MAISCLGTTPMGMKQILDIINRMEADGAIDRYAIGGAVAAYNYVEPAVTEDLDILVSFDLHSRQSKSGPVTLGPLLSYLKERGYSEFRKEGLVIEGWPVQFLPVADGLDAEALAQAEEVEIDINPGEGSVKSRVLGRSTSLQRHCGPADPRTASASCSFWRRVRWRSTRFATSSPATVSEKDGARFAFELELQTPVRYNPRHEALREDTLSGYFRHPRAQGGGTSRSIAFVFRPENCSGRSTARASCAAQAGARTADRLESDGPSAQLVLKSSPLARRFAKRSGKISGRVLDLVGS